MKTLVVLMLAAGVLLSGCVTYGTPYRDGGDRHGERDRDQDRNDRGDRGQHDGGDRDGERGRR